MNGVRKVWGKKLKIVFVIFDVIKKSRSVPCAGVTADFRLIRSFGTRQCLSVAFSTHGMLIKPHWRHPPSIVQLKTNLTLILCQSGYNKNSARYFLIKHYMNPPVSNKLQSDDSLSIGRHETDVLNDIGNQHLCLSKSDRV